MPWMADKIIKQIPVNSYQKQYSVYLGRQGENVCLVGVLWNKLTGGIRR